MKTGKPRWWILSLGCALSLAFFSLMAGRVAAQDMFLLTFGNGKTEVKLYADYFCGPCSNMEPKIEYLVGDLVRRHIITVTFIDAPFHKYSALYAKYFFYILNEKKEIGHALKARDALFEAAKDSIYEEQDLGAFLQRKGFKFKPFDVKATGEILQGYLREDQVGSTPTCVIIRGKDKETAVGSDDIVRALTRLR
ncbi:MAG TPA: thioredoxin domain-containing protein [Syntrophorhabdaceae bacterium]|nr:thioredoxin domain-containing protein [Syntrophorhabdaceae bacterium]